MLMLTGFGLLNTSVIGELPTYMPWLVELVLICAVYALGRGKSLVGTKSINMSLTRERSIIVVNTLLRVSKILNSLIVSLQESVEKEKSGSEDSVH